MGSQNPVLPVDFSTGREKDKEKVVVFFSGIDLNKTLFQSKFRQSTLTQILLKYLYHGNKTLKYLLWCSW